VGLNVATRRRNAGETRAVFLSGMAHSSPYCRRRCVRDELTRSGNRERKGVIHQRVEAVHSERPSLPRRWHTGPVGPRRTTTW